MFIRRATMNGILKLGIDIGSTTVKAVVLTEENAHPKSSDPCHSQALQQNAPNSPQLPLG